MNHNDDKNKFLALLRRGRVDLQKMILMEKIHLAGKGRPGRLFSGLS